MVKIICDACGEAIKGKTVTLNLYGTFFVGSDGKGFENSFDLCQNCAKKVIDFIGADAPNCNECAYLKRCNGWTETGYNHFCGSFKQKEGGNNV